MDLGAHAVGVLLSHRLQQDAARAAVGDAYADHDLVFAREDGNSIHPERVSKRFGHPVTDSGSPPTRLHDLRHARASLSLASGTDIALVSKILGHSSISVTDDTYAPLEGVGRRDADAAGALAPRSART